MHFPAALSALLAINLALAATPSYVSPTTRLYICTDASFSGTCTNLALEASTCQDMAPEYAGTISSAGPDNGTFCVLYSTKECRGLALPFTYPGLRELARYGFADVVESVRCDLIVGWDKHL